MQKMYGYNIQILLLHNLLIHYPRHKYNIMHLGDDIVG